MWLNSVSPRMYTLSCQLMKCFEGIKSVVTTYQVLESSSLSNASYLDIEIEAKKFSDKFAVNVSLLLSHQMLSIKTSFKAGVLNLGSMNP